MTIDTRNVEKAIEILDFHNDRGGWRASKENDEIMLSSVTYNIVENERVEIPEIECSKELHVKDEYDTDNSIDEHILHKNLIIITPDYAGSGKSYICQSMADRGYRVIFVNPTTKLLQAFEGDALTINIFLVYLLVIHI